MANEEPKTGQTENTYKTPPSGKEINPSEELNEAELEQVSGGITELSRSQSDAQKSVTQNLSV